MHLVDECAAHYLLVELHDVLDCRVEPSNEAAGNDDPSDQGGAVPDVARTEALKCEIHWG